MDLIITFLLSLRHKYMKRVFDLKVGRLLINKNVVLEAISYPDPYIIQYRKICLRLRIGMSISSISMNSKM